MHLRSTTRNRFLLMIGIAVIGGALSLPVSGFAQPATIYFTPDDGSFGCGETITVDLVIDTSITDLRGFSFVLEFDPAIIQPLGVSAGSLVTGAACTNFFMWLNPTPGLDNVAVDGATLGCSIAGAGAIVSVTFEGFAEGISAFGCREGLLRDGSNAPIPFDCVETTIDYRCPVPNDTMSWGAAKAIYR